MFSQIIFGKDSKNILTLFFFLKKYADIVPLALCLPDILSSRKPIL